MSGKRVAHRAEQRSRSRTLLGVVSALVVLLVLGILAVVLSKSPSTGGDDTRAARSSASASDSASGDTQSSSRGQASARPPSIRACAEELSLASTVVHAAARGVSDWSGHVQARTDMLQGRISVTAMEAIWKRTRLAGPADQSRFQAARKRYQSTSHCRGLRDASTSNADLAAGCASRAQVAATAVSAAELAMRDWQSHLGNMVMHADGRMNSVVAQRKWVAAWRHAPRHIAAYRSARLALDKATPCQVQG